MLSQKRGEHMIEVKNASLQYTTFKRPQGSKGAIHDFFKRTTPFKSML